MKINKRTNPTAEHKKLIKKATKLFFKSFDTDFLVKRSGIPRETVYCHKSRSKVSPLAAIKYCEIKEVAELGFTKQILRPDVKEWC